MKITFLLLCLQKEFLCQLCPLIARFQKLVVKDKMAPSRVKHVHVDSLVLCQPDRRDKIAVAAYQDGTLDCPFRCKHGKVD